MNRKDILLTAGIAALAIGLIALPGPAKSQQETPQAAEPVPQAPARVRIMRTPQAVTVEGAPALERVQQELTLLEDQG
ncbi:MAG TPA: hypothetical protein VK514_09410, partial [Candidatus Acidoferrum sp.]|nr:hypothetical protein [Candidatus Acidoferrum sp.]